MRQGFFFFGVMFLWVSLVFHSVSYPGHYSGESVRMSDGTWARPGEYYQHQTLKNGVVVRVEQRQAPPEGERENRPQARVVAWFGYGLSAIFLIVGFWMKMNCHS